MIAFVQAVTETFSEWNIQWTYTGRSDFHRLCALQSFPCRVGGCQHVVETDVAEEVVANIVGVAGTDIDNLERPCRLYEELFAIKRRRDAAY